MASSERFTVFLVGAVQFVNILDFMMVMPLGPDFAKALTIPESNLGLIGGSYTLAAALAGIAGTFFLDRFDRRPALAVCMFGLVLGTLLGGFATGLWTLIGARFVAGAFGGPAAAISLAIIADVVPVERRGRAMGAVMTGFAVASTVGVPIGLKLAEWSDWRLPFFAVAGLGVVVSAAAVVQLPPLRGHLAGRGASEPTGPAVAGPSELATRPTVVLSLVACVAIMFSTFILVPNLSPYLQENLAYPRNWLSLLYFVGGIASLVVMPVVGRLVDRFGAFATGTIGSILYVGTLAVGFVRYVEAIPILALFVAFMITNQLRNLPFRTLTTKVPRARERASYMSVLSAVQHLSAALGAFVAAAILGVEPSRKLVGMPTLGLLAIGVSAVVPPLLWVVERDVNRASFDSAPSGHRSG